jgi:hypothetical protein
LAGSVIFSRGMGLLRDLLMRKTCDRSEPSPMSTKGRIGEGGGGSLVVGERPIKGGADKRVKPLYRARVTRGRDRPGW